MRRTVRILKRAQVDLLEIQRYVERDRPSAAERLMNRLLESMESLQDMPERGVVPRDEKLAMLGYRVLVDGVYLTFYKVLPSRVVVYRVLHGRRKYADLV